MSQSSDRIEHLPECPKHTDRYAMAGCICDLLRACEQRVRDEILTAAYESAPSQVRQDEVARLYNIGFADALDAAREAVEREWTEDPSWDGTNWNNALSCATDAIDALREERA